LVLDLESLLVFVACYLVDTGQALGPQQTMRYGYWVILLKPDEGLELGRRIRQGLIGCMG
jgi:hypothetical protein